MSITVYLALLAIFPLALILFALLPIRWAISASYVVGWLFLPVIDIRVIGMPDFDKVLATNMAVMLACLVYGGREWVTWRPRWFDVPIVLFCLVPWVSSITNGLGIYDGFSVSLRSSIVWLIPYLVGRVFFRDSRSMFPLALAIIAGGVVYIPFCLFEVRMSPQLNDMVYGFRQNQFFRNLRFAGYRPVVFMQSGLMVGVWMATATGIAFWLWQSDRLQQILRVPMWVVFVVLFLTTVLCKALYAILLLFLALALLLVARYGRLRFPIMLVVLAIPTYMVLRTTGALPPEMLVSRAERMFGADRAQSLEARLTQERLFSQHAFERPVFGWGGWNRSWPVDSFTGTYAVRGVDGLWISVLGKNGLVGLSCLYVALLLPVVMMVYRHPASQWVRADLAPASVMAVMLLMFVCDSLLNNMYNPLFLLVAGGIIGLPAGVESRSEEMSVAAGEAEPLWRAVPRRLTTGGPESQPEWETKW